MSKEHQFVIKTIVRGDRTPMYLETYSLGDRASQVYKDAMKLLNSGDAQQEASLELVLAVTKEQDKHRMQPTGVRERPMSYVSPGMKLARELEERYPNKNWKGRVNKAFDAYNEPGSKYTPQDIACCLLALCPNPDMESKYRELMALDYNVSVNVVRDILRIELDRMIAIDKAMENRTTLHLTLDAGDNPTEVIEAMNLGFATQYEKVGGVLFNDDEEPKSFHPLTVIPLENNLRAWVRTEVLNSLVCQAVDNDWTAAKLRRKVEHLFNTVGSPAWFTVVEGWFNTAMDDERASRGNQQASPIEAPQPHFIVGDSETREITSVTQTTYYRNEQFDDYVCFGSAPGSRSQEEIIGVLAYEMDANENEPDCVSVMHYQFFYQGDSVFVTDRYGNTVDRLR